MITDQLIEKIIDLQNPTCVGLDTLFDYLPDSMKEGVTSFEGVAERVFEFNKKLIDTLYDIIPSVKVQIAYYEMYGVAGMKAFEETVKYAKEKDLIVIADAKRNDIGSTASCYAKTFLGKTAVNQNALQAFPADYVTVNGYLGADGILPFVEECQKNEKGIFVLVKTSNPSGAEIQNVILENGKPMFEHVGALVEKWGESTVGTYGYSAVGAVVGATHPTEAKRLREILPHTFHQLASHAVCQTNEFRFRRTGTATYIAEYHCFTDRFWSTSGRSSIRQWHCPRDIASGTSAIYVVLQKHITRWQPAH